MGMTRTQALVGVLALAAIAAVPVAYPAGGPFLGWGVCWVMLAVVIRGSFIVRVGGGFLVSLVMLMVVATMTGQFGEGGGGSGSSSSTAVNGYTKKDGTRVAPHTRRK